MKTSTFLAATTLVLTSAACVQLPDMSAASYGTTAAPYWPQPVAPAVFQPAPYQPPSLTSAWQATPQPVISVPTATYIPREKARYIPAPSFSSTSLLGPQRADWKPGGGF